ncbi:hypothetical protein B0H19DRAFT_1250627 [Mycena capillaripes]|nr:hypothetical protein B0H19DRAFT_1250627 [Mycena capillaripes]
MFSEASWKNEFPERTAEEHRKLAEEYRNLSTEAEKEAFFAVHGVHWTEFARLEYFDIVKWTVVDPMHNLLLGIAKTQWYQQWIKTGALRANTSNFFRELNVIHDFLESFEAPLWAGRLPLRVGEPSGGSLTADEYKCAVTGPWAIMIPIVWDRFLAEAKNEHTKALETYRQAMGKYRADLRAWESGNRKSKAPAEPKKPVLRMQAGEDVNFLRFATLLKILVGSSMTEDGLDKAENLLQEYLLGFLTLYGADTMKPNHHWAVHIPHQVRDFGPLYSFWAFVTERLNKVLKNLKSNIWPGGRLEVSMMREFQQMSSLDGLLNRIFIETADATDPALKLEHNFMELLLGLDEDVEALGTIQDAALHEHREERVVSGEIAKKAGLIEDDLMLRALVGYYNKDVVRVSLENFNLGSRASETEVLHPYADTYDYVLLDGRRLTPITRSRRQNAGSSLVQVIFDGEPFAGELHTIFRHKQVGILGSEHTLLAFIHWMVPSGRTPLDDDKFIWYENDL